MPQNSDGRPQCEVIAEAGVNHNGSIKTAKSLIDKAAKADADVVKFQTFDPSEVVTRDTKKASYQERSASGDQYEMLDQLTLTNSQHVELFEHCKQQGIEFMSTPYDPDSVAQLESVGVQRYKIASADIVNKPLLDAVVETSKPVILSTGMATLGEIERAVEYLRSNGCPDLTLLHCVSCYPAKPPQINMRFMDTLDSAFEVPVGYSDHSLGTHIPVMAVSRGAILIEKHFTLDRDMDGPDHFASLEPDELAAMISNLQEVEGAMGQSSRSLTEAELENRFPMRRSLHARNDLEEGTTILYKDLKVVRPDEGIDPWLIEKVVGSSTTRNISSDEALTWSDIR